MEDNLIPSPEDLLTLYSGVKAALLVTMWERIMYATIMRTAKPVARWCKALDLNPCSMMETFVTGFKVVQFTYVMNDIVNTHSQEWERIQQFDLQLLCVVIGLPLLIVGQILNLAVYRTIGRKGVYYGTQFGVPTGMPWCTGFPYNRLENPQYIGVILTFWGIYYILASSAHPLNSFFAVPWAATIVYGWSCKYEGN